MANRCIKSAHWRFKGAHQCVNTAALRVSTAMRRCKAAHCGANAVEWRVKMTCGGQAQVEGRSLASYVETPGGVAPTFVGYRGLCACTHPAQHKHALTHDPDPVMNCISTKHSGAKEQGTFRRPHADTPGKSPILFL
eukprot:1158171-Pelagomonas_calceolata.AAC.6